MPLDWLNKYAQEFTDKIEKESLKGPDYDYTDTICFWGGTISDRCFCRWWIILTRIAWCLEQASEDTKIYNEYAEEFNKQSWKDINSLSDILEVETYTDNREPSLYSLKDNNVDPELKKKYFNKEAEISKYRDDCKNEAFDLIKKYFWNLWD